MTDLKTIPAVRCNGSEISLAEVLQTLQRRGQLRPILTDVAAERLIVESARKEGLAVSDAELEKVASRFRIAARLHKREDTEKWLTRNRLSQDDLETALENSILGRKMFSKVADKDDVEKYFADNRDRFDRVRLSRIVVKEEGLANELLSQINEEGADYVELLKKHSIDERGKRFGPRLIARKRLPPDLENAVFSVKPGDIAGPLKIGGAWHLIKVHEVRRGKLDRRIIGVIRRLLFRRWLRQQLRDAKMQFQL